MDLERRFCGRQSTLKAQISWQALKNIVDLEVQILWQALHFVDHLEV